MAEVEYGGVKVSGKGFLGKLIWILPLMGTLAGGSWAVFEFYKDYEDMKEAVQEYVSPDMGWVESHISETNAELKIVEKEFELLKEVDEATSAVIREQINSVKAIAATLQTDLHDLRMDLNQDVAELNNHIEVTADKLNANLDKQTVVLDKQEARNRQSVEDVNKVSSDNVTIIRGLISSSEERRDRVVDRLDKKLAETQDMMDALAKENRELIENLKKDLDDKIRKALENPLAGMSK
jgi:regulator of replication initiation timing|tara:strand:- start:10807 stop:11520 length:714 start_codon:yes stop_codon:yes gene_type:complete